MQGLLVYLAGISLLLATIFLIGDQHVIFQLPVDLFVLWIGKLLVIPLLWFLILKVNLEE